MVGTFEYEWNTPVFKGKTKFPTGLYIGGQWVEPAEGGKWEYVVLYLSYQAQWLTPSVVQCGQPQ